MDRLQTLQVFVRVVDEGGFAAAARAMQLSPAAVTRLVADLEDHLGVRLLQRSTRRVALTEAGEQYLQRVRPVLAELDEAAALVRVESSEPRGTLRVLSSAAFGAHYLGTMLADYQRAHPRVNVQLDTGFVQGVDESHDVSIIVALPGFDANIVARKLAISEVILCASPAYLAASGPLREPSDVRQHRTLLIDAPNVPREQPLRRVGADGRETLSTTHLQPSFMSDNFDVLFTAAQAGAGLVSLPSFVAYEALRNGRLQRVLPEWHAVTLTLYAGLPTRKYVAARTRAFLDLLAERLGPSDRDPWLHGLVR